MTNPFEPEDELSNDDAAQAIRRGETAPWVRWCREQGVDPRDVMRLLMAQGTTTVTEEHGIRMTVIDQWSDDVLFMVDDDGEIVGGITGLGET